MLVKSDLTNSISPISILLMITKGGLAVIVCK